jgi:hypothetical protein
MLSKRHLLLRQVVQLAALVPGAGKSRPSSWARRCGRSAAADFSNATGDAPRTNSIGSDGPHSLRIGKRARPSRSELFDDERVWKYSALTPRGTADTAACLPRMKLRERDVRARHANLVSEFCRRRGPLGTPCVAGKPAAEWSEAPACTQRTGACFHAALGGWGAEGGAALLGAYMGRRGAFAR